MSGTLTAEQVRDVIERHSMWVNGNNRCFHNGAYEDIAAELNSRAERRTVDTDDALNFLDEMREADRISYDDYSQLFDAIAASNSRAERTCHKVIPDEMESYVFCSECGAEIGEYGYPNYCPNCGCKVAD